MTLLVKKFGGTSMGDASTIKGVADLLKNEAGQVVAVVSATSGTTDVLIHLGEEALNRNGWMHSLEALSRRHYEITVDLGLDLDLSPFWDEIEKLLQGLELLGEVSIASNDRLISFGERISSAILAAYLNKEGYDAVALNAYELIFTDDNFGAGSVDFEKSFEALRARIPSLLDEGVIPVVTGFVAQSESGKYITLGRGGSDYSASIVAVALHADELQIWTDVDGIFNTDPRYNEKAKVLEQLSFNEASELAYFGARVLHPKTIKPALSANIPVRTLNTFNPSAPGTVINNESVDSLKSVTYKKGIIIVNICSDELLESFGFLAKIFEIFGRHGVVVDVVSTSEVSVSLTVEDLPEIVVNELEEFASVDLQRDMAIVCLVGNGIQKNKKILSEMFSSISEHDVSMVSQGASKRNITFLVKESCVKDVVEKIFNTFFK